MLLKSFKRRVSWATAIVLQFNNIKRELSCEGLETWDGWTPSPRIPVCTAIVVTNRDPPPYYSFYFFVIDHYAIYLLPSCSITTLRSDGLRNNKR